MVVLIALVLVVAFMIIAASKYKFHPFLSLLLAGIVMGFVGGLNESRRPADRPPKRESGTRERGFGRGW